MCSDTFESYDQHYGRALVKDTIKDGTCRESNLTLNRLLVITENAVIE